MCSKTFCYQCGKTTWEGKKKRTSMKFAFLFFSGCGQHIEQTLRDVPFEERCRCVEDPLVVIVVSNPNDDFQFY